MYNLKISKFRLSIISLLMFLAGCTNPYSGVYQAEGDTARYVIIDETVGVLTGKSVFGEFLLEKVENNNFKMSIGNWKVNFDSPKDELFQKLVLKSEREEWTYKRIVETEYQRVDKILSKGLSYTSFDATGENSCEPEHNPPSELTNKKHKKLLGKLIKQIKSGRHSYGLQESLLISKDNKLIVEEYFNAGYRNNSYSQRSVSKSLTSLLFGIAINDHAKVKTSDSIVTYLPDYQHLFDNKKSTITIANALNMATGFGRNDHDYNWGDVRNVGSRLKWVDDSIVLAASGELQNSPGTVFDYSESDVALIAQITNNIASTRTLTEYAKSGPLSKLCFKNSSWGNNIDGRNDAGAGVKLRPIDMLKIGQLMLNNGKWKGNQIVSEQWIKDSMDPAINPINNDYGYFWWRHTYYINGIDYPVVYALGAGDQYIVIVKKLNLVIAKTAYNYDSPVEIHQEMRRFILPAFIEE